MVLRRKSSFSCDVISAKPMAELTALKNGLMYQAHQESI